MNCGRASEVDLTEWLRGQGGAVGEEFRDHYPRCPECASEVHAWTAVHGLLVASATPHPLPKKLLWFGERPQSLAADERQAIETHVGECRLCRDELTTLRSLDLHALTRPLASINATIPVTVATPTVPSRWRAWLGPQLAVAVVALGLVPLLVARLEPPPGPTPAGAPPALPAVAVAEPSGAARDKAAARAVGAAPAGSARPGGQAKGSGTASAKPEPVPRARREPPPPPAQAPPSAIASVPAGAVRVGRDGGVIAPPRDALPHAATEADRAEQPARNESTQGEPTALASGAQALPASQPAAPPAPTVRLRAAGTARLAASEHSGVTLLAPSQPSPTATATADIRIVDAAQRRELRQQGTVQDGTVSTQVPGDWLTPGDYQVEVNVAGVLTVYRLTVSR